VYKRGGNRLWLVAVGKRGRELCKCKRGRGESAKQRKAENVQQMKVKQSSRSKAEKQWECAADEGEAEQQFKGSKTGFVAEQLRRSGMIKAEQHSRNR
jgi:hypothetical protein